MTNTLSSARWLVRKTWRRLRSGARHRAHRREAGLAGHISWYECYAMALKAFEVGLESSNEDVERELLRLFLPLNASEMTQVAVAMAVVSRPTFMGTLTPEDVEVMKLDLAVNWLPELDT